MVTRVAHVSVSARNIAIERDAGGRKGIIAPDRDLAIERPGFAIERSAQDFENVHARP
jgi:hypothetical protein